MIQLETSSEDVINVRAGSIDHSLYKIKATLFHCSGVAFDFYIENGKNKGVFLAHAVPGGLLAARRVNDYSVIDWLIEESKQRQLDPTKSQAIVNAGSEKSLDIITRQLERNEIPIISANTNFAPPCGESPTPGRVISYAPNQGYFNITPVGPS